MKRAQFKTLETEPVWRDSWVGRVWATNPRLTSAVRCSKSSRGSALLKIRDHDPILGRQDQFAIQSRVNVPSHLQKRTDPQISILGFGGRYPAGVISSCRKGPSRCRIPNPHKSDTIDRSLVKEIFGQAPIWN